MATKKWDPSLYDSQHSFVWELADSILGWLAPQQGETILDLGCGTGHLSARIAEVGAHVIGLDSSPAMIASAREKYPEVEFRVDDARTFRLDRAQDAIFSNAALHWIPEADMVVERVHQTLRRSGRFVAEFGGAGNVGAIVSAAKSVLEPEGLFSWPNQYYPTAEAYAEVLEQGGMRVRRIELVPRLTRLQGEEGLRTWLRMFRGELLDRIPPDRLDSSLSEIEEAARPPLYRDGAWHADYVRLRVEAHRP